MAVAVFGHRGGCRWAWRGLPFLVVCLATGAPGVALRRLVPLVTERESVIKSRRGAS